MCLFAPQLHSPALRQVVTSFASPGFVWRDFQVYHSPSPLSSPPALFCVIFRGLRFVVASQLETKPHPQTSLAKPFNHQANAQLLTTTPLSHPNSFAQAQEFTLPLALPLVKSDSVVLHLFPLPSLVSLIRSFRHAVNSRKKGIKSRQLS
jgi:hypothetical protein